MCIATCNNKSMCSLPRFHPTDAAMQALIKPTRSDKHPRVMVSMDWTDLLPRSEIVRATMCCCCRDSSAMLCTATNNAKVNPVAAVRVYKHVAQLVGCSGLKAPNAAGALGVLVQRQRHVRAGVRCAEELHEGAPCCALCSGSQQASCFL